MCSRAEAGVYSYQNGDSMPLSLPITGRQVNRFDINRKCSFLLLWHLTKSLRFNGRSPLGLFYEP